VQAGAIAPLDVHQFLKVTPPTNTADEPKQPKKLVWLLGRNAYQRVYLRYWLLTSSVYLVLLSLHAYAVSAEIVSAKGAALAWVIALSGLTFFYVALRSGWSKRFADPAMTAQQMIFAFFMLSVGYVLNSKLQGALMIVTPLVLIFSAFTLPPRRCRQLGLVSIVAQASAIAVSIWLLPLEIEFATQVLLFACSAVVYTMAAEMSARLSMIRLQLRTQKKALSQALERNASLARSDALTNLPNRRYAMEMLEMEERRVRRETASPCVCMIDIDHFKRVNDQHGHGAGDEVLRLLASYASAELRSPDMLARWGGEEFLLVMTETALDEGLRVLERLRNRLAQPDVWQGKEHLRVTFSSGIASLEAQESIFSAVSRADAALYLAKQQGRNCTVQA
jgi:diguanylate cyclase (GGDEF)-like protein